MMFCISPRHFKLEMGDNMKNTLIFSMLMGSLFLAACNTNEEVTSSAKEVEDTQEKVEGLGWEHNNSASPDAGDWKPVEFPDGSKYTIEPPPANESETTKKELEELRQLAENRTEEDIRIIQRWASEINGPNTNWNIIAEEMIAKYNLTPPESARVYQILNGTIYTASIAAFDEKYLYLRPRPTHLDSKLTLIENFSVPAHPAYPSAHATTGWAAATVLSYLFPNDGEIFIETAQESDLSRKLAGVHYESDNEAGRNLGKQIANDVIDGLLDDNAPSQFNQVSTHGHK